jgi:hypothetical protein
MTPAQVRAYQETKPRDWNGALLGVDGNMGERTRWSLFVDDLPRFRRIIIRTACMHRGITEAPEGSNRHPLIDEWVRDAGGKEGDPWCAAYVFMLLTAAGLPAVRTVSAKACLEQYPLTDNPTPGDLAGWVNPDSTGHVFPIIGFTREGFAGMEGNSNNRVRLTSRARDGLQFRRVVCDTYGGNVYDAPLIVRAMADVTR